MNTRIVPMRDRFHKRKKLVLFICTGNTCRSPMATGFFRKLMQEKNIRDIEVRSAGVMTITGLLASQEAVQVMQAEEIDISRHRSTQLTSELIHKADLILSMTPFHRQTALRMSEDARPKTFLLKEFTRSDLKNVQIADPMGCTLEVFKKCFKEIKAACTLLTEHEYIIGKTDIPKPMTAEQAAALRTDSKKKPLPARKPEPAKAEKKPAEHKSAEKKPAEKKPVEKKPAEKAAAEKKPAAAVKTALKPASKAPVKAQAPAKPAPKPAAKAPAKEAGKPAPKAVVKQLAKKPSPVQKKTAPNNNRQAAKKMVPQPKKPAAKQAPAKKH